MASIINPETDEFIAILGKLPNATKWKYELYKKVKEKGLKYSDFLALKKLADCESNWRQFDLQTGEVLSGSKHPADKGIFQINTEWHPIDKVMTPEGNLDYAVDLYSKQGVRPWVCSTF